MSPPREEAWGSGGAGASLELGQEGRGPSVSILSRSPLGEPADDGINLPPSGPLPPSLCWGCHDNQSSPWMPKTPQKQQQRLHPQLEGKRVTASVRTTAREACGGIPLHNPPEEWEPGICKQLKAEWVGWSFPPFPVSSPTTYIHPRNFSTVST